MFLHCQAPCDQKRWSFFWRYSEPQWSLRHFTHTWIFKAYFKNILAIKGQQTLLTVTPRTSDISQEGGRQVQRTVPSSWKGSPSAPPQMRQALHSDQERALRRRAGLLPSCSFFNLLFLEYMLGQYISKHTPIKIRLLPLTKYLQGQMICKFEVRQERQNSFHPVEVCSSSDTITADLYL